LNRLQAKSAWALACALLILRPALDSRKWKCSFSSIGSQKGEIMRRIAIAFALGTISIFPAQAIEPGEYSNEVTEVKVTGSTFFINVAFPDCQGDVTGKIRKVSANRWRVTVDDLCSLDVRKKGKRYTIEESEGCFNYHGAACSFDGTVQ
jgi:hypothetical protein